MLLNKSYLVVSLILTNRIIGESTIVTDDQRVLNLFIQSILGTLNTANIFQLSPLSAQANTGGSLSSSFVGGITCLGCKMGVAYLKASIKAGVKNEFKFMKTIAKTCTLLKIQPKHVCKGIGSVFSPDLTHILKNTNAKPDEICNVLLGETCGDAFAQKNDWQVNLMNIPKPVVQALVPPSDSDPRLKVLHITDTHVDPSYSAGSNADCSAELCCRINSGKVKSETAKAGYWGDYRKCDTPLYFIDDMVTQIKTQHPNIDYIIWTGDIPPHDPWEQTKEHALQIIGNHIKQIGAAFPNIPIYPVIGNHEPVPINNFPSPPSTGVPERFNVTWLYNELDILWRTHLRLPASISSTVKKGAYYSILQRPGFRIISLNSMFCYTFNWWLVLNSVDPMSELQWLITELQNAETAGEKVHIISHIPPGTLECTKVWSRNFNKIISRYEGTVMAQFYGHTHYDEFEVMYDINDSIRPINMVYVGPSVTTYDNLNPAYRIYYVDGDRTQTTRLIADHETWITNITHANKQGQNISPVWQKLYSAKAAYGLNSMLPSEWDAFITRMSNDRTLFNLYQKHYWHNSDNKPTCDKECRKTLTCDARSGRSYERPAFCQSIYEAIEKSEPSSSKKSTMMASLFGWMSG